MATSPGEMPLVSALVEAITAAAHRRKGGGAMPSSVPPEIPPHSQSAGTVSLVLGLLALPFAAVLIRASLYTSLPQGPTGEPPFMSVALTLGVLLSWLLAPLWFLGALVGMSALLRSRATSRTATIGALTNIAALVAVGVTLPARYGEVVCRFVPCDAVYEYSVENHQDREVQLVFNGLDEGGVRPCSVRSVGITAPPLFGRSVPVLVKDGSGRVVFEANEVQEMRLTT
jgi:hypothetical protein